jgi:fused
MLGYMGQILRSILSHIGVVPNSSETQAALDVIYRTQLIQCLVEAIRNFGPMLNDNTVANLAHILSELVLTSSRFMAKFTENGGLQALDDLPHGVFTPVALHRQRDLSFDEALVCGLQLASHLARHSDAHHEVLSQVLRPDKLALILQFGSPTARSKCCNFIGNRCRHSARFYSTLAATVSVQDGAKSSIASLLVGCCSDTDPSTRKFACFAIGNAAFHNPSLYKLLASAVRPLTLALTDADDKTRANAAGALGNLARNGGDLAHLISKENAPRALLDLILTHNTGFKSSSPNISSARTALFSLGTMAVYSPSRAALIQTSESVHPTLDDLFRAVADAGKSADETVLKYLTRLKTKLASTAQE